VLLAITNPNSSKKKPKFSTQIRKTFLTKLLLKEKILDCSRQSWEHFDVVGEKYVFQALK
jgi:hypothetical protein